MPKLYQMLETKSRKEQESRVEWLLKEVKKQRFAITVFVSGDSTQFDVVGGTSRITSKEIKDALQKTIENITLMELEAQLERNNDKSDGDGVPDSAVDNDATDSPEGVEPE